MQQGFTDEVLFLLPIISFIAWTNLVYSIHCNVFIRIKPQSPFLL